VKVLPVPANLGAERDDRGGDMRRTRLAALVLVFITATLAVASGALAAAPTRHASGGGLPYTGIDLKLVFAAALGVILVGVTLRRVARQET
jgi:hypothetical protein